MPTGYLIPEEEENMAPVRSSSAQSAKQLLTVYFTAFPNQQNTIEDIIAEENKEEVRITSQDTHKSVSQGIPSIGAQIDHYEIVRQLGRGGMSRVYLATDLKTQQPVVLKFPDDDLMGNIAGFERYRREAKIGKRLNHPHILHLLNTDEERSDEYLAMEYIEGRTLRALLKEHKGQPPPLDEALRITNQICDALVYCHEHGVYHRDIKPENILLQPDGNVKIIDFGIAFLKGARRLTWRGLSGTMGTPGYLSPEQLRGERGLAGSDIYAVGVILYEMLCGRTPFDGETIFAVMNQQIHQDPPSILDFNPQIPLTLATVVMRAIRRDHAKRYQSIAELRADLADPETVTAVPYEPTKTAVNTTARRVITVSMIILAIFLVIIALGFFAQNLQT